MNKCLFLDRDGVINIEKGYVHHREDFEFIDGIKKLLTKYKNKNFLIIVITNQAGIARGFYNETDFKGLTNWMKIQLGNLIDEVYFCPHHPTEGVGMYKRKCDCRKPKSGMLKKAKREFNIDFKKSIMVGDKFTDLDAANKVGINKLYLFNNKSSEKREYSFIRINSFDSIIDDLFKK